MADPSSSTLTRYKMASWASKFDKQRLVSAMKIDAHGPFYSRAEVEPLLAFQDAEIARLSARLALVTEAMTALRREIGGVQALLKTRGPVSDEKAAQIIMLDGWLALCQAADRAIEGR